MLESDEEDFDDVPNNNTEATTTSDRRPGKDGTLQIRHGTDRRGARDRRPTMAGGPGPALDRALADTARSPKDGR
jgi:hypothetical protein